MDNKRKVLYDQLSKDYDLGDFESFSAKLNDEGKRKAFYDAVSKDYDLGDYESFVGKISDQKQEEPYTHKYDKDMNLVGGTAYQAPEPYQYKPEVQQHILQNKPDMFKPKTVDMYGAHSKGKTEMDMLQEGRLYDMKEARQNWLQRPITTFGESFKQGSEALYQGGKNLVGEAANVVTGSQRDFQRAKTQLDELIESGYDLSNFDAEQALKAYKDRDYQRKMNEWQRNIASRRAEREDMGFFESLLHKMQDPSRPKSQYEETGMFADELQLARSYQAIQEALQKSNGNIQEAYKLLGQKASKETWGDETTREARTELAKQRQTEGFGAWAGGMIPQMVGNIGATVARFTPWGRWLTPLLGYGNMAYLTGATSGMSMAEARDYAEKKGVAANEGEVWRTGMADAAIEYVSEKIPFNRYFGKAVNGSKNVVGKLIAEAVKKDDTAASEMGNLLSRASKEFGAGIFSGKNVKDYLLDVGTESLSEFTAEALQTITPMIYQNPEDYPTLARIWNNGLEGAKGGLFMGAFLGAGNRFANRYQDRKRREKQGEVTFAETNAGVFEVLGVDNNGNIVAQNSDGEPISLNKEDVIEQVSVPYEEFKSASVEKVQSDADIRVEEENAAIDAMTNLATGEYIEVDRWVVDSETGVRVPQPGNIVGWIGEAPVFVPEGMENTEENRIVLKPNEWNPDTVQKMPAEQVKAVSEEMIREEAAQQAEMEAKYAPEVINAEMQQGVPFNTPTSQIVPVSPLPEGNGWIVEEYALDTNNKVAKTPIVRELTNDEYRDMLQSQIDAQEAVNAPVNNVTSGENVGEQVNAGVNAPVNNPNVQPVAEGVATEQQATQPQAPVIPTKEDGSIDFVSYGKDNTFKTLGERYGEKMPNKVAVTAKALADDLKKAQKKLAKAEEAYDNAPIGREQKAEEARDKAKAELEAIQKEADFWAEMDAEIKNAKANREALLNPQADVDASTEPMTTDEFIAQQLAVGNIVLSKDDYMAQTGYGAEEVKAMNGGAQKLITDSGMTLDAAGERLMEIDRENGTNFFNQDDATAGRDALIELLGSVRTRKELNQYIAENRKAQAKKESEAIRNASEEYVMSGGYESLEDYLDQMEAAEMENPFLEDRADEIMAIFAEEAAKYEQSINNAENGQGTENENAERSDSVLPEEQSDDSGRTEEQPESERVGDGIGEEGEGTHEESEDVKAPLRKRAKEWEQKLGVKVNLIESLDEVTNREVIRAIKNGQRVTGWFEESTGEVCFYMPYLESENEVDSTYIHEVVAHNGLRGLLGDKFDAFCDEVWESMSVMDKAKFITYPGVNGNKRAAADEYIAHLAENIDVTDSAWNQLTELIKKFLKAIGLEPKMTNADIANTIKKSYQRLLEGEGGASLIGEGTRFSAKKKRALETASVSRGKHQPTVVSSADGAKILNNLDNLAKEYEEKSIIDKAKADGTYMLAPNGEPTNLTEKQWAQVRTEAFKKWFGDWEKNPNKSSLMIDENGEPKVYYHGSPSRFNEFISDKMGETGTGYGQGFYFSPEKWFAEGYVGENGGTLYEVFLNLRKPISDTKKTLKKPSIKRFIDEIDKRMMKRDDDGIGILDNWDDVSYYGRNKVLNEATEAVFEYNETDLEIVGDLINTSGSYDVVTEVLRDILGFDGVLPSNTDNEVIVHHPNQIKSATDNVGTFDEGNNDIRFRFIGERGARNLDMAEEATTRLDNLAVAREMEAAEKDAKTIKMATGWERGADGLWRYEVDDNIDFELRRPKRAELKKAYEEANEKYYKLEMRVPSRTPKNATEEEKQRIKELRKDLAKLRKGMNKAFDAYYDYSAESATLGEFLGKDNQLFKEYPELADYDVSFLRDSKKLAEGLKGSFTPEYKVIWVDDARPKGDIKSTLVHEIQHAIQGIEGFAQGGTPAAFASAKYQAEEWKTNFNKFINRYGFEDWSKNLPIEDWMKYGKEYKGQFGGLHRAFIDNAVEDEDVKKTLTKELDYVKAAYDKFYQIAGGMDPAYKFKDANEWYRSLSGEVESRNVQQRMGMTDEQRRNTLAESTEDVSREDQVFLKDGIESGETRFRSVNEPAVDYVSQANDVVEVPRNEVMYTMNNIANQLYKTSGRFMRQLYKYGTLGRVLKGEYAEIDQIKAKNEYDHAKPILEEYLNELVWMKYQATEAAQKVINDVISDVEYAMQYYKDLSLGKDVWRTQSTPRFRISEKGKQIQTEVDEFTEKYNSKEVVVVEVSSMSDKEIEDMFNSPADEVREAMDEGLSGGYNLLTDKIYIFVDNQSMDDLGNTLFHENMHPSFHGDEMIGAFDEAVKDNTKKMRASLRERGYREDEIAEEVFVRITTDALLKGDFKNIEKYLPEEYKEDFYNKLKDFGYDTEEEIGRRTGSDNQRIRTSRGKEQRTSEEVVREGRAGQDVLSGRRDSGRSDDSENGPNGSKRAALEEVRNQAEQIRKLFDQVADMGLEGVLGNKAYSSMMVDIYKAMPEDVRAEIADDAIRHYGGSVAPAVNDFIGPKSDGSFMDKVVAIVREALRKIGIDLDLNANEVRYMAWRSKKPLDRSSLMEVAEDIDMRYRLKVGEYDGSPTPDGGGTRFRTKKPEKIDIADNRSTIIKRYDEALKTGKFNFQEAFQDRMLSLKVLMDEIVAATGKKVRSFEDAYEAENQLSSINKVDQERYIKKFYTPLVDYLKEISKKHGEEIVRRYIYCKSGLERNEVLRQRDADEAFNDAKEELDEKLAKNQLTQAQYDALLQQAEDQRVKTLSEDVDYSGIRGMLFNVRAQELFEQYQSGALSESEYKQKIENLNNDKANVVKDWKDFAEQSVADLESRATSSELDELWSKINAATNETLRIDFESGMIDRETYEAEKKMMKYYVPLRDWKNTKAEEMYEYRHDMTPAVTTNQQRAKGRESEAANPMATIALMAQNAIVRGNRNKMKMKLYSFVVNRPTDLASVRNVWYVRIPGTKTWEARYADTSAATSEAEIKQIMEQFEADMELLEEQGEAKRGKLKLGMGYRASRKQKDEHVVVVMINGKEYGVYINGNPRAAQAVNGLTNAENVDDGYAWIDNLKRLYGGSLTSWNPDFIIPNFVRDTIHASTMTFLDRGVLGSVQYMANIPKIFAQVSAEVSGLSTGNAKLHQYFEEFVNNGGETGYTEVHTLEDYKKEYQKLMDEAKGLKAGIKKGVKLPFQKIAKVLEAANRIAEDVNRFNAYVTSREAGENIVNSISAAKNITVNFNRKGALHANSSVYGKVASFMSRWILFFNPSVQGIYQLVSKSKMNPKRATALGATIIASGFFMPLLNEMLVAAFGGGDEDDYWNQSDFKRRNNWMLFTGDGYVSIPLPPVLREIYGMGDIIYGVMTGHIPPQRAIYDVMNQVQSAIGFVTLLPEVSQEPDVTTWLKGFGADLATPFLDVMSNTNFMGRPIAKWTDYNETDPEYERTYKGVGKHWVALSKLLNEMGGNETRRSDWWGNMINPAMMEHLVTSYTGGIGKTINNLVGMAIDAVEGDTENMDVFRKTPIISRFYTPNDEKTVYPGINRKYYEFEYQYNNAKKSLKKSEDGVNSGKHPEWQKYIDEMGKNGEKKFIEYFKKEQKNLKKLQDELKKDPNNKEAERKVYDKKAEISAESFKILSGQK